MSDDALIEVHGRGRTIVDLVQVVLAAQKPVGDRPVAVLVDPEPEHWAAAEGSAIVVVTSNQDADTLAVIRRGADAVVDVDDVVIQLPTAVATVQAGGAALTPLQARVVVDAVRRGGLDDRPRLTRREAQIIQSVTAGDSVKGTAKRLGIAPKTVENLQSRLFRKLGVRNRTQAMARVHELGLLDGADALQGCEGDHSE